MAPRFADEIETQLHREGDVSTVKISAKANRANPYKNYKFQIRLGGKVVAGFGKVSPFDKGAGKGSRRGGAGPSTRNKGSGRSEYDAITLERGVTIDTGFDQWANQVQSYGGALGSEVSLANFRKDLFLDFMSEAGQRTQSYKIYRCWVSEYRALPDLDAGANAVAIQHIKLENEGFERDTSVTEEPSLSK
jgi:phage tail-like protein